jgi:hypothetical protein
MTRRPRRPAPPPAAVPQTEYWLHATIADLVRLLRHDVSAALRAQVADHVKRGRYETADAYVARLGDLVDDVGAVIGAEDA